MKWPQITMIILLTAVLFAHGKDRKVSFWERAIWTAIIVFFLYCGGFWG